MPQGLCTVLESGRSDKYRVLIPYQFGEMGAEGDLGGPEENVIMHLGLYNWMEIWTFHTLLKIVDTDKRNGYILFFAPSYQTYTLPHSPKLHPFLLPSGIICQVLVKVYIKGKKKKRERMKSEYRRYVEYSGKVFIYLWEMEWNEGSPQNRTLVTSKLLENKDQKQ